MWTIIKYEKKNIELLKSSLKNKLGEDSIFYCPKLLIQKYKNNKLINKEFNLLGDYLFCFHKSFSSYQIINNLQFTRGLKYFLMGFEKSQNEITRFIKKCKESENEKGYLSNHFLDLKINSQYKFSSGPFVDTIFKIINFQKNKINILLGNIKTTINKEEFLYSPL